ncbi:hypothetical protein C4553_00470 [Candidatus Parcubacteria bacterium]|nr:MAG: hypothetical protein C4553_00470 [Candidatus Parcubacteria bacterium]
MVVLLVHKLLARTNDLNAPVGQLRRPLVDTHGVNRGAPGTLADNPVIDEKAEGYAVLHSVEFRPQLVEHILEDVLARQKPTPHKSLAARGSDKPINQNGLDVLGVNVVGQIELELAVQHGSGDFLDLLRNLLFFRPTLLEAFCLGFLKKRPQDIPIFLAAAPGNDIAADFKNYFGEPRERHAAILLPQSHYPFLD